MTTPVKQLHRMLDGNDHRTAPRAHDAFLAALQGLCANAQVCMRQWSPVLIVRKAAEVATAAVWAMDGEEEDPP